MPVGELFGLFHVPTPAIVTLVARATLQASVDVVPALGTARNFTNLGLLVESVPGARDASVRASDKRCRGDQIVWIGHRAACIFVDLSVELSADVVGDDAALNGA